MCLELGATGVSFGFLDHDLEIDRASCSALAAELVGVGWTFHRGFDQALEARRALGVRLGAYADNVAAHIRRDLQTYADGEAAGAGTLST